MKISIYECDGCGIITSKTSPKIEVSGSMPAVYYKSEHLCPECLNKLIVVLETFKKTKDY